MKCGMDRRVSPNEKLTGNQARFGFAPIRAGDRLSRADHGQLETQGREKGPKVGRKDVVDTEQVVTLGG